MAIRITAMTDAEADHLYSAHEQRQALFKRVETWMRRFTEAGKPAVTH